MDYAALVESHKANKADITIAAQPADAKTATQMGIFRFNTDGTIIAFEEKPKLDRLAQIGRSIPPGSTFATHDDEQPFMASMGIYVFTRRVLIDMLHREAGVDFGRELIPNALDKYKVMPYLYRGYWADVGTIESFYDANVMLGRPDAPFRFWHPQQPIYTHLRHLPTSRMFDSHLSGSIVGEGCSMNRCRVSDSVVGVRGVIRSGARVERSVLLGADFYEDGEPPGDLPTLGIGRDVVLDRVIIDKNARIGDGARLVNERNIEHEDGNGYFIRGGIIVVPKNGVIRPGVVV
jgi:glucose-1-phosphate adenylyltransferase